MYPINSQSPDKTSNTAYRLKIAVILVVLVMHALVVGWLINLSVTLIKNPATNQNKPIEITMVLSEQTNANDIAVVKEQELTNQTFSSSANNNAYKSKQLETNQAIIKKPLRDKLSLLKENIDTNTTKPVSVKKQDYGVEDKKSIQKIEKNNNLEEKVTPPTSDRLTNNQETVSTTLNNTEKTTDKISKNSANISANIGGSGKVQNSYSENNKKINSDAITKPEVMKFDDSTVNWINKPKFNIVWEENQIILARNKHKIDSKNMAVLKVVVKLYVNKKGKIKKVETLTGVGVRKIDLFIRNSIKQKGSIKPPKKNGVAVKSVGEVSFDVPIPPI
ncbi:hypothetical protein VH441_03330 [Psychrobacter sp. HD31]|uniref:hypothetical protein n=1 Tax=Psychrobacter sp. HD31 TaxID=3112003 RepID=UPI003DA6B741